MSEVVLFETLDANNASKIGVATLNAEKSLNSLSVEMVGLLMPQLEAWQADVTVVCVVLQAAGEKAFCAGGDIRRLYDTMVECGSEKPNEYAEAFFENEYRLDYLIHTYKKPLIVWGHGIVMGGGIGLMSGASHRVVTEKSRLAMPEINIGLYPDVGSTWFLNHTPGRTGLFLGLTGANINAADALFVGLADRFVMHEHKAAVLDALKQANWVVSSTEHSKLDALNMHADATENHAIVSHVLRSFEDLNQLPESKLREHFDLIQAVTDGDSLADIAAQISSLRQADVAEDVWISRAISGLEKGCPTTAHLVYQQLQRGKKLSLESVFQMELIMSLQCAMHPDFPEGVRALLVDKDGKPKWQHESIAAVPAAWIEQHFVAPWGDAPNPLTDLNQ